MKDDDVPAVNTTEYVKPATTTITQVSSGNNDAGVTTTGSNLSTSEAAIQHHQQSQASKSADDWLQSFYTEAGLGTVDAAGREYWEGDLKKGQTQGQIIANILRHS